MVAFAYVLAVARILIGLSLAVSAYARLHQDYEQGVRDVLGYRLVGRRGSDMVAFLLPVLEMTLSAALVLGLVAPASNLMASVLLVVLAGVALSATARGLVTDCRCWGSLSRRRIGPVTVVGTLAAALVLVAEVLLVDHQRLVLVNSPHSPAYAGTGIAVAMLLVERWFRRRQSCRSVDVGDPDVSAEMSSQHPI